MRNCCDVVPRWSQIGLGVELEALGELPWVIPPDNMASELSQRGGFEATGYRLADDVRLTPEPGGPGPAGLERRLGYVFTAFGLEDEVALLD